MRYLLLLLLLVSCATRVQPEEVQELRRDLNRTKEALSKELCLYKYLLCLETGSKYGVNEVECGTYRDMCYESFGGEPRYD